MSKKQAMSNKSISIQPATVSMTPELVTLIKTLGYSVDQPSLKKRLKEIISRSDHLLLVAKVDDQIAGFCHGYLRLLTEVPKAMEIGGLAVKEAFQRQGIGKKLIKEIEDLTIKQKIKYIVLSSNVFRKGAHRFYQKMGYKILKQQHAFEKEL